MTKDPSKTAIITIATGNQLHRARALMRSAAQWHPNSRRFVFLVDTLLPEAMRADDPFTVVPLSRIGVAGFRKLAFALDATALCCALKPHVARHALEALGCEGICYFDSDVMLYGPIDEMIGHLAEHEFVLTPHTLGPADFSGLPAPRHFMLCGVFNGGMFGIRNSRRSLEWLEWWGRAMLDPQNVQPRWAYDQPWLAFATVLLPSLGILRHAGYNVAYWNLGERPLARDAAGNWRAGRDRLIAFHFSAYDEATPGQLTRSGTVSTFRTDSAVRELIGDYEATLRQCAGTTPSPAYGFGRFADGKRLTPQQRAFFQARMWSLTPEDADPFSPDFEIPGFSGVRRLYRLGDPDTSLFRALGRMRRWPLIGRIFAR